jgi:hypothetical protein
MPVRLRLPLALLACAVATVVVSLALWRLEQADVRADAGERAHAAASGLEERADAAVLALEGVRAAYDASGSVDAAAFATHARVPLARPEIVAVGWAPRVSAAQRGTVEAGEQIWIGAPADAQFTYPLLRQEPAGDSPNVLDLGSDSSLGEALLIARSTGRPRLSAPVHLDAVSKRMIAAAATQRSCAISSATTEKSSTGSGSTATASWMRCSVVRAVDATPWRIATTPATKPSSSRREIRRPSSGM